MYNINEPNIFNTGVKHKVTVVVAILNSIYAVDLKISDLNGILALTSLMPVQCCTNLDIWPTESWSDIM